MAVDERYGASQRFDAVTLALFREAELLLACLLMNTAVTTSLFKITTTTSRSLNIVSEYDKSLLPQKNPGSAQHPPRDEDSDSRQKQCYLHLEEAENAIVTRLNPCTCPGAIDVKGVQ